MIFISCKTHSQIPQPNSHISNSYIDKFQGIWKWASGSDSVIIKIGKVIYFYKHENQSSEDVLVGCHAFYRNGILVESSLQRFDTVLNIDHRKNTIFCYNLENMDTSKVEGGFKDITKMKRGDIFLEYLGGSTPQISWSLKNSPGINLIPHGTPNSGEFTLPISMILTKQ